MIIVQYFLASLLIGPIIWGGYNWYKYKGTSVSSSSTGYKTMFNSAVLYALAFNIIFFIQELFLVLGKKALGLESTLYHNNHTWEGDHPMALLMQGSGALAIFLFGLICLVVFQFIKDSKGIWKLLILWLAFHGLVQSLPQVIIAPMKPGTDVGEALIGYLNISQPTLIIYAVVCVAAVVLVNIWIGKQLLGFGFGEDEMNNPKARFRYIRFIAVGAAILGSVLIVPFRIFPMHHAITPFIVSVFSIPWIWASSEVNRKFKRISNRINEKIYWGPIIFLMLLLIFFQLILAPGVKF